MNNLFDYAAALTRHAHGTEKTREAREAMSEARAKTAYNEQIPARMRTATPNAVLDAVTDVDTIEDKNR